MTVEVAISEPQQARSRATRDKLLEATISALVERGYAGTSTTAVAKRAGMSQGALYKHFPTKPLMLREALAQLFAELIEDFRRGMARRRGGDPLDDAITVLWRVFSSPRLTAAFELYLAARTDEELAGAIRPVLEAHQDNLQAEAREHFPVLAEINPRFGETVSTLMNLMQGAALAAAALPLDPRAERAQQASFRRVAREQLGLDR